MWYLFIDHIDISAISINYLPNDAENNFILEQRLSGNSYYFKWWYFLVQANTHYGAILN